MCKAMEDLYEEGIEKGIKKGRTEEKIQFARQLLQMKNMSPEQIADFVGLPLEKVLTLC